jgi:hypothetical protein
MENMTNQNVFRLFSIEAKAYDGDRLWIVDPWPVIPTSKIVGFEKNFLFSIPSEADDFISRFSTLRWEKSITFILLQNNLAA